VRDLRWAVTGLIVGTTLLSGCSEKVEANDTLPPTSAAETTEALPPVGPADFPVPDEARTKDAAGARAFLDYWVALLNRQQAIPDGQPLRDLGPDCHECLRIARVYDESAAAGRRYVGGQLAVVQAPAPLVEGNNTSVAFIAQEEAVQLVDASGATVQAVDAASDLSSGITLKWSEAEHAWLVVSMTLG
jgi:hypothetical protein